jgi:hypothetical protein
VVRAVDVELEVAVRTVMCLPLAAPEEGRVHKVGLELDHRDSAQR